MTNVLPLTDIKKIDFIEPHEKAEAQSLLDKLFTDLTGDALKMRPCGYMVLCKIYVRPEEMKTIKDASGKTVTLWNPPKMMEQDKFDSVCALVVAVGPQAYKGKNADGTDRYPEGAWASPGTWCVIPRQSAFLCTYRGVALAMLPDDKVAATVEDPTFVTSLYVSPRI